MIVLDTNVLSELTKPVADLRVVAWIDAQPPLELVTTAISKAEMLAGAQYLDEGHRKRQLLSVIEAVLRPFERTMLDFDAEAAMHYSVIAAKRRRLGRPIAILDAQIAAIALSRGARVATRDADGFSDVGLDLIDPWAA